MDSREPGRSSVSSKRISENQGLLTYRWEESTQGPPRKYYCITDKGREQLKDMDTAWQEMVRAIDTLKA